MRFLIFLISLFENLYANLSSWIYLVAEDVHIYIHKHIYIYIYIYIYIHTQMQKLILQFIYLFLADVIQSVPKFEGTFYLKKYFAEKNRMHFYYLIFHEVSRCNNIVIIISWILRRPVYYFMLLEIVRANLEVSNMKHFRSKETVTDLREEAALHSIWRLLTTTLFIFWVNRYVMKHLSYWYLSTQIEKYLLDWTLDRAKLRSTVINID